MTGPKTINPLDQTVINDLNAGTHSSPADVLGPHEVDGQIIVTAIDPGADTLFAVVDGTDHELTRLSGAVFRGAVPSASYRLHGRTADGASWHYDDAFRFGSSLTDEDIHFIAEGSHMTLWRALGASVTTLDDVSGTRFAVWAPDAQRVSVIGDFNAWDHRRHPMTRRGAGVWEIFVPGAQDGARYKFSVVGADGQQREKADPVGFGAQHPPETASVVRDIRTYDWDDQDWMETRAYHNSRTAPISVYEVHLGSWRRRYDDGGRPLSYQELAVELVDYVKDMGFTHIELMPISEFPFDGSWGYQPVGLFAPTIRFGLPNEFREMIEAAHNAGLGVLIDWVPGHFPTDAHGLETFDGTALYEHADPREGFHQDWNTLIYNYGRTEVQNFLVANAVYWLEEYHIDGLRVDAVASMLYRDYSRKDGEWVPNKDGGRENYEAIAFMQRMNIESYGRTQGAMTVAEESTSFPKVSAPVDHGGLGFGFKWNMGWMNDTLRYMEKDPIYRSHDHHLMTFGIDYAFTENFILPISHDEVVHGKGSMLQKMPGNRWEQFANLRAYYGFMWTHPGKKLLFMGCELAQDHEWNHDAQLDWDALHDPAHAGIQRLIRDLNRIYRDVPALHVLDCMPEGFEWIDGGNTADSVFTYLRRGAPEDAPVAVAVNMTPIERSDFRIGVPEGGYWTEIMNTDSAIYGGENRGNLGGVTAEETGWNGRSHSIRVTLPPLSAVVFKATR
jgi:1,4-alpha-glucan branching enzyme